MAASINAKHVNPFIEAVVQQVSGIEVRRGHLSFDGRLAKKMVAGNATALLNQRQGEALNITTPAIAAGSNLSIHLVPEPALVLGLITRYGPIEISIAMEEKDTLTEIVGIEGELTEV